MSERLKESAWGAVGCLFLLVLLFLSVLVLKGMVWLADKAYPWLNLASLLVTALCIIVLLPLSVFRKARAFAGNGLYWCSYIFGTMLFAYSCLLAYAIWGYGGLIVGLFLAGVGVVPVAVVATIFSAHWAELSELAYAIFLTFGTRALGLYVLSKVAHRNDIAPEDSEPIDVKPYG